MRAAQHAWMALGACLLAAAGPQGAAVSDSAQERQPLTALAGTIAEAAEGTEQEDGGSSEPALGAGHPPKTVASAAGKSGRGTIETRAAEPATGSQLLRSLSDGPASSGTGAAPAAEPESVTSPAAGFLSGCPRGLLAAMLGEAAETDDAVSALAIEREILALCRERQEIVTGIVTLEGELGALLEEAASEGSTPVSAAHTATIEKSAPVRVVALSSEPHDDGGRTSGKETDPSAPAPPAYAWFSIIGTSGDLRAGVSDGMRVWFVREGDRLPGGLTVERIAARPPGVHVGGDEGALPYGRRPRDAMAAGAGS